MVDQQQTSQSGCPVEQLLVQVAQRRDLKNQFAYEK
jgi:hypothetical protein